MSPDAAWLKLYDHQTQRYFYVNQETNEWSKNPPNGRILEVDPASVWSVWDDDDAQATMYYHSQTNQWTYRPPPALCPIVSLSALAKKPSLQRYLSLPPYHQQRPSDSASHFCQCRPLYYSSDDQYQRQQQQQQHHDKDPTLPIVHPSEQQPLSPLESRKITNVSPKVKKQGSLLQISKASIESAFRSKIFPQSLKKQQPNKGQTHRSDASLTIDLAGTSTTHMQCCPCASPKTPSPRLSPLLFSPSTLSLTPPPPPLSPSSPLSPQSATSPQTPTGPPESTQTWSFEQYAKKHFKTHKRGLLVRNPIPLDEMSRWTKKSIHKPLLLSSDKTIAADALECFKKIQVIMGDRPRTYHGRACACDDAQDIQSILLCGTTKGQNMRDEIYVQLCKQLNHNPTLTSTRKGWELVSALCLALPPSRDLLPYLIQFVDNHHSTHNDMSISPLYIQGKLKNICSQGFGENMPSRAEIQLARISVYQRSHDSNAQGTTTGYGLFGAPLTTMMTQQLHSTLKIPSIVPWLVDAIHQLHGHSTQGIFRIPGLTDQVTLLRTRLEETYPRIDDLDTVLSTTCIVDPNVPASLLRVWLRELPTSLIPEAYYDKCIEQASQLDAVMAIVNDLPDVNRRVLLYLIGFMQEFLSPDVYKHTLMTPNNLAMVFAPNLLRSAVSEDLVLILQRSKYEQLFVKTLLLGPVLDMHQYLYG